MDFIKMTKAELITELSEAIKKLDDYEVSIKHTEEATLTINNQLNAAIKLRDEAVNQEFNLRKEKEKIEKEFYDLQTKFIQLEVADKDQLKKLEDTYNSKIKLLEGKLNSLAELFEEYIKSYKDQISIIDLFTRNIKSIDALLDKKITDYNGGSEK